jgi:glucose/arabinose dehydrogenase/PKD repeat protein
MQQVWTNTRERETEWQRIDDCRHAWRRNPMSAPTMLRFRRSFSGALVIRFRDILHAALFAMALLPFELDLARAELPPGFVDEPIHGGFVIPVDACFDGTGRMFVAEKRGMVRVVQDGVLVPQPLIDLTAEVHNTGDKGLLGITLDPAFAQNGWIYLLYNVDPIFGQPDEPQESASFGRLTRYTVSGNVALPASRLVLLGNTAQDGIANCYSSHSIGTVAFGTDGSLFVGAGEGSHFDMADGGQDVSSLDYQCAQMFGASQDVGALRAQTFASLAGKILRVNPATGAGYSTNPFYDGNLNSFASRIWSYGLRNPFRFAVRPGSPAPGTLYIGDVGWAYFSDGYEELNVSRFGGENFGWPCWEGPFPQPQYQSSSLTGPACDALTPEGITLPILAWQHLDPGILGFTGGTISGVAFYTGSQFPPQYDGVCFFSDYVENWIRYCRLDALDQISSISEFGFDLASPVDLEVDPDSGTLAYVAISTGEVRRIRFSAGNLPPIAMASANPVAGGAPLPVQFSSGGTYDPNGDPMTLTWDFGDGTFAFGVANPQDTYNSVGTFNAILVAADTYGAYDSATVVIETANLPPAAVITHPSHGSTFFPGQWITFDAAANDPEDGADLEYDWDVTLIHNEHLHPGWFTSEDAHPEFEAVGHGGSTDRFSYMIRLTVRDSGGLAVADTSVIVPSTLPANRPPVAGLHVSTHSGGVPLSVNVSGTDSADPDSDYLFYNWSFGDGTFATGPATTHVYSDPGLYTITLTVIDPVLAQDWTIASVLVDPPGAIATWTLDENGGATALDSSGNDNHASLSGGPAWIAGIRGSALQFDGVDDGAASGFGLLSNRSAFTLCAWVRQTAPNTLAGIAGQHDAIELGFATPSLIEIRTAGGGSASFFFPYQQNVWHHIAATGDGQAIKIYFDGDLKVTEDQTTSNYGSSSYRLRFGGGGIFDPSGNYLYGSLEDVRVYSTALSPAAIASFANLPPYNSWPIANAGPDFAAAVGEMTPLIAEVIDDGLPAPPGQMTFLWSQLSGPVPAAIAHADRTFALVNCPIGGDYVFEIRADDSVHWHTDTVVVHAAIPTDVSSSSNMEGLLRIVPNPMRENAVVHYRVAHDGAKVRLRIYDVTGRLVSTIKDGVSTSGSQQAEWNGRVDQGEKASAGIYFIVLEISDRREARKLVLLR